MACQRVVSLSFRKGSGFEVVLHLEGGLQVQSEVDERLGGYGAKDSPVRW